MGIEEENFNVSTNNNHNHNHNHNHNSNSNNSGGIGERTEYYDCEQVLQYLKHYPQPGVETMAVYEPDELPLDDWKAFLKEPWEYKLKIFRKCAPNGNVVIDGLAVRGLKDLLVSEADQAIELLPVRVVSISDTEPYYEFVRYRCLNCYDPKNPYESEMLVCTEPNAATMSASPSAQYQKYTKPGKNNQKSKNKGGCGCDNPEWEAIIDVARDCVDAQWVRIQELRSTTTNRSSSSSSSSSSNKEKNISSSGKVPITIPALLRGKDMMWTVGFNEQVSLIGLVRYWRYLDRMKKVRTQKWFDIFGVRRLENNKVNDMPVTEQDIQRINEELEKPMFYEKLLASFCPHVYGMTDFKEACLLAIGSIKLRHPARILICADPGMAKSEILQYTSEVSPNSYYVTMAKAKDTGLTVTAEQDKDTGSWMVTPGLFAAAHQGLICIDELQQGKEKDISNLNDVVESGKIRYALVGGNYGYFDANAALVIATNPYEGKIGGEENIYELLKFIGGSLPAFLSRMNLVLFMRDDGDYEEEEAISRKMFENSDPNVDQRYEEDWTDENGTEYFGKQTIRKIIRYIVDYVEVQALPKDFQDDFVKYYMGKRKDTVAVVNKLVNRRYMRHAMVLAQIVGRLCGSSVPTKGQVERVFQLLERNMETASYDPRSKTVDSNILNGNLPLTKIAELNKKDQWMHAIHQAMRESEDGKFFTSEALISILTQYPKSMWTDPNTILEYVERARAEGKILEKIFEDVDGKRSNRYTWLADGGN